MRYRGYGLQIDSELEIIGAQPISAVSGVRSDIQIAYGLTEIGKGATAHGPYRRLGDQILLDAADVGQFLCIGGEKIIINPAHGSSPDKCAELLIATALPALLWMRGAFVVHAAAALLLGRGQAIAITGASGVGKSTVLAQLARAGAAVVGDDSITIASDGEGVSASGLPGSYFLANGESAERRRIDVPLCQQSPRANLGALFILERQPVPAAPRFERLQGVAAFEALLRSRHRPRVPHAMGLDIGMFDLCTFLCRTLPIYLWHRVDGEPILSADEYAALDYSISEKCA